MPKFKNVKKGITSLSDINKTEELKNKKTAAEENADFVVQEKIEKEQEILEQIEAVLEEGSYRETPIEEVQKERDDGIDGQVFVETKKEKKIKKAKKPKKPYEHTTFAHKMKVLGVLLILGVFTGSGLGVWYFNYELRSSIDYSAYNASDYIQSVDDTFKKNSINATAKDGLDWVTVAQNSGLTPADLTPADNFILAQHNITLADTYEINGVGHVDSTGVRQSIISRKKFNGSYYTFESISPSKISFIDDIILCDKYVKNSKTVTTYESSNTNPSTSDWKFSKDSIANDYVLESGNLPSAVQPYIISEKTVLEPTNDKSCVVLNQEEGTYSFTMKLETTTSVLNYARQVKRTGGLGSYPEFTSISFSVVIDSDWNLISFSISENYSAVKGIRAKCSGFLNYTVTVNEQVEMPV